MLTDKISVNNAPSNFLSVDCDSTAKSTDTQNTHSRQIVWHLQVFWINFNLDSCIVNASIVLFLSHVLPEEFHAVPYFYLYFTQIIITSKCELCQINNSWITKLLLMQRECNVSTHSHTHTAAVNIFVDINTIVWLFETVNSVFTFYGWRLNDWTESLFWNRSVRTSTSKFYERASFSIVCC